VLHELHSEAIAILKELGADNDRLWLVETQKLETAANFYGDYVVWDLAGNSPEDHDSIIYYHESGSINQHSTFNRKDQASFKKAVRWIARYLGADLCPECLGDIIDSGEIHEVDEIEEYKICRNCGHRWQSSPAGRNVIL